MSYNVPESTLTKGELGRLANFRRELADALDDALVADTGGGFTLGRVTVTEAPYNADPTGVTDCTTGVQMAIDVAAINGYEVYFPPGTYLLEGRVTNVQSDTKIVGRKATLKFDSTLLGHLITLASGASRVTFEQIRFEGNVDEDDKDINQYAAIYLPGNNFDVTCWTCTFTSCRPTFVAQGLSPSGRMKIVGCDVFEAPLPISVPSDSVLTLSHLVNEALVSTRSHGIYVFGFAENVRVINNMFKNIWGDAVKFNSASARYSHKNCGIIAGNDFQGGGGYAIWIGSDSGDDIVGNFVFGQNTFHNTQSALYMYNVSSWSSTGGNVALWDWEATGAAGSITAGIIIASAVGVGQLGPANGMVLSGWTLRHAHPFVGKILFSGTAPADGDTVAVGSVTYTWKNAPTLGTHIQVMASPAGACEELRAKLRGARTQVMNPVLRGPDDAFELVANDALSGTLVIASDATFTLSTTGTGTTVVAAADRKVCFSAVHANETANLLITGNVIESFNYLTAIKSYKPVFKGNTLIDAGIFGNANFMGDYEDNRFETKRPQRGSGASLAGHAANQLVRVSDAWPDIRNNRLIYDQEYTCPEMMGSSGVVPVSDGKAYADFYYGEGVEASSTSHNSIHFKWTDGDLVRLVTPAAVIYDFTYKGTSPGANEFNSITSLRALIDGAGGGGVFLTSFVPTASVVSADLWIRITYDTVAANGNDAYILVQTQSWITGRLLTDADATFPDNIRTYFKGGAGSANTTKTWYWTPRANPAALPRVQGMDATSKALNPWIDPADVVRGVGMYISHDAAGGAGAESFQLVDAAP